MLRRQYKLQANERRQMGGLVGRSTHAKRDSATNSHVDPEYRDEDGRSHLHLSVFKYCVDDKLFDVALKAGCNVDVTDSTQNTALHYAAEKGFVTCVDKLIKKGANVDIFNKDGMTPLMLAVRQNYPTIVRSLTKATANINLTNRKGELALHFGCSNGSKECVEILLKHKAKINYPDNVGNTPLTFACKSSCTKIVEALLEKGARVDKVEESTGRSPLILAVLAGNLKMVEILLRYDPNLDTMDKQYNTAFNYSISNDKPDMLRRLVDAGCDRSTIDGLNGTAMALASLKGYGECVQILLEAGEDPDEIGYFGMTALMAAAYESHGDVVEILLKGGANPMIISRMGFTALFANLCHIKPHNAAVRHRQTVLLLKYGADVNHRINNASVFTSITNGKNCSMSFAISSGYVSLVKMFLCAGSDIKCNEITEIMKEQDTASFFALNSILCPIREYRSQPVPLQHSCRLEIRKQLGDSAVSKISTLPIARAMKDYLCFHDLYSIKPEYATMVGQMSEVLMTFVDVKPCGLSTLKGSFLFDMVHDSVIQSQNPGPCDCDTCKRIRAMPSQRGNTTLQ